VLLLVFYIYGVIFQGLLQGGWGFKKQKLIGLKIWVPKSWNFTSSTFLSPEYHRASTDERRRDKKLQYLMTPNHSEG
jgi:hypothetical protein